MQAAAGRVRLPGMGVRISKWLAAVGLIVVAGCGTVDGSTAGDPALYRPADELLQIGPERPFAAHVDSARAHLGRYKVAVPGFPREQQVDWSLPFERAPAPGCTGPETGLLLIHGLADSPFVFRDLADALAASCVRVRAILLPGHGTRPGDLVTAESEDWFASARWHLERFADEVDRLYVGGHSMGGAIATVLALEHDAVQGLVAMAPSWELNGLREYLWLATLLEPFMDFLEQEPEINPVKYETLAVNTGDEIGEVRQRVQALLRNRGTVELPTLLVATEADSVIDLDYLQRAFRERLIHPSSRFVLYRDTRKPLPDWWHAERMTAHDAYDPDSRVLEMSHQALPVGPRNPLYGRDGALHHCLEPNGADRSTCLDAPRDRVWYGAYSDRSPQDRIVSRLTWNPHFDALVEHVAELLAVGTSRLTRGDER